MDSKQNSGSFQELKNDVEDIAKKYFECLKKKDQSDKCSYQSFINKVKIAYSLLDSLEQQIINNEFFFQDYPNWWKKIYPKTTFYRIKRQSMINFLEAFEHA